MSDIKIVFMGTPEFAVPILEGLINNYNVVGVVSQPDKRVGRKQELVFTPVKKLAVENGIVVFQPEKIREDYNDILKLEPDIIITCAYGQIIPKEILSYPRFGCINVHASLLPKLRGGAPIHRAIMEGYKKTGVTIMYMDEKMDSGDIISQEEVEILDQDNLESLYNKLSSLGRKLLLETLPSIIEGTNERISQDLHEVTYGYNIQREEEYIDFSRTSREIYNQIRGLSPWIGACCKLDGEEFKIYGSVIGSKTGKTVGEIIEESKMGIGVTTGDGEIIFTDIKPFGKKRMNAYSYINGLHNSLIGKVFE